MIGIRTYFACILFLLAASSCAPKRNLAYFSNMPNVTTEMAGQAPDVRIHKNDIVSVSVNSMSQETNFLFAANKSLTADPTVRRDGYRVNKDGLIHLPVIGDFNIEGLSVEEAQNQITEKLGKYVKNPAVEVQLVNFKITVIGEVNRPSTFTISDEKVNLLEALGMAGDMTVYGRRENVLVIRNENNHRVMKRLDLNKQETMDSPYFFLKQNDIVYVEPDRSKAVEYSSNTRVMPLVIATISAVAVVATVFLQRY